MTWRRLYGRDVGLGGGAVALSEPTDWRPGALDRLGLIRWRPDLDVPLLSAVTADLTAPRWVIIEQRRPGADPDMLAAGLFADHHPPGWEELIRHGGGLIIAVQDATSVLPGARWRTWRAGRVRAHVHRPAP
ncbi:hypothetical protein [Georgenia sp. AZ-5]|uniref:hypothetical protein n=1 Tax=Georgenia sp. AZ-5 TaxID=3367526 RepID=UPI003754FEBD